MGRSSGPAGTTSAAYTVMPTCGFRSARRKGSRHRVLANAVGACPVRGCGALVLADFCRNAVSVSDSDSDLGSGSGSAAASVGRDMSKGHYFFT